MRVLLIAGLGLGMLQSIPVAPQTKAGVIRVLVRDPATSEPVPDAEVNLTELIVFTPPFPVAPAPPGQVIGGGVATRSLGTITQSRPSVLQLSAKTDANGMAVFESLAPNRYNIRAQREGYLAA